MSGLIIVETVRDQGSAAKLFSKRPGGMRVIELLRTGRVCTSWPSKSMTQDSCLNGAQHVCS